jgi:outer membrane protein assembly factor BamB
MKGFSGAVNNLAMYPVGMYLADDGSLVITFQGRDTYPIQIGIVKVDRRGKVIWKRFDNSSHWIAVDGQGLIYTPYTVYRRDAKHLGDTGVEIRCQTGEANVDRIRVLTQDGQPVREIKLVSKFIKAGYRGVFYGLRDGCDPVHLNSIDIVTPALAARIPGARAGDLVISLREASMVALIDGESGAVKYAMSDRTAAQHGLRFLPDGTLLAFDNQGGDRALGGSRVVRLDLVKGTAETLFPRPGEKQFVPFYSDTAGHIDVSDDGKRALVTVTHQGRILELDVASGKPLWDYETTHDVGKFLEENNLRAPGTVARFATYGAYYVHDLKFIKESS